MVTPAPRVDSYGTSMGVASLTPRYAGNSGDFTSTTRPTDLQVNKWIDNISSMLNIILADHGFAIPIVQINAVIACETFVEEEVASIVEGVNGSGRFGPVGAQVGSQNRIPSSGRFGIVTSDIHNFIATNALGFERVGCLRTQAPTDQIAYRDSDQQGMSVPPLFERKGFRDIAKEWDNI